MADIGHFEFGELHRMIAFEGVENLEARYAPDSLDYWVAYWIAAFSAVDKLQSEVHVINYERACEDGHGAVKAIAECLDAVFPAIPYCIDLLEGPFLNLSSAGL